MKFQCLDLLMKLRTGEEAIEAKSTVPLDQLKQANQIFTMLFDQVMAGLYGNTEKLYQEAEELRKQRGNVEDLSAHISQLETYNRYLEVQCREYELKLLQQSQDFLQLTGGLEAECKTKIRELAIKNTPSFKGSRKVKAKPEKELSDVKMSDDEEKLPKYLWQKFTEAEIGMGTMVKV